MNSSPSRSHSSTPKPADLAPPVWRNPPHIEARDRQLADECGISAPLATILRQRKIDTAQKIRTFLEPAADSLCDPFDLPDIETAIERLYAAIEGRESIQIFGDYDVDGITSTALLMRALKALKADVDCVIPERHDGYGLSTQAVEDAAARDVKLIISCDCGIGAIEPALRALQLGVDLIITDHHEPGKTLPEALAVVNPKRADSRYGFRELSGCGVAFRVLQALLLRYYPQHAQSFDKKFIELVGLSTVADCVPLVGENRYLAREGLRALATTKKRGLQALFEASRLKIKNGSLSGRNVGFNVAPRLNAAGRIDSARKGLELLLSSDDELCRELAGELEDLNKKRQEITAHVMEEAFNLVYQNCDLQRECILVIAGEGWPHGIIGLVASRLVEKFARPAIVIGIDAEGVARGSGRSIPEFDLTGVIYAAGDLLESGGGHAMACGLSLFPENIEAFTSAAQEFAAQTLDAKKLTKTVQADCLVQGGDLTPQLAGDLQLLEPCGNENPEATFLLQGAELVKGRSMGAESQHVKWSLRADGRGFEAVWFYVGAAADGFAPGSSIDICFVPEINEWNGNKTLQLIIKAARLSAENRVKTVASRFDYGPTNR